MSKRLILLARPHALSSSRWVQLELEHFIALDRSPIVIECSAVLPEGSPLATLLQERRSIREEVTDLDGSPSDATIQELVRSFDATRQETIRMRALGAAAALFIAIALAAVWQSSPSQMGRFETQWLAAPANLSALADLSGQWIELVHGRRPPRGIVLDMDSSVSPTHGEQEMSVWNGHYAASLPITVTALNTRIHRISTEFRRDLRDSDIAISSLFWIARGGDGKPDG
jgi:hypothetical protein